MAKVRMGMAATDIVSLGLGLGVGVKVVIKVRSGFR